MTTPEGDTPAGEAVVDVIDDESTPELEAAPDAEVEATEAEPEAPAPK